MKVKFITLGCKVNQYESQALSEEFAAKGFEITSEQADLYVVNTCTVTRRADAKSKQAILRAKKENPKARTVALGCMVKSNEKRLESLGVDYIVTQDRKQNLLEIILNKGEDRNKNIWSLKISEFFNHRAFVKIQDGCDNFCTFCKIPYLRGKPRSRPKTDILDEIKRLSSRHKEIVLCGINLTFYGKDLAPGEDLTSLIKDILNIKTVGRVRLSSLESGNIDDDFLGLFKNEKLCPHLHLPFQSGNDRILKLMNKKATTSFYRMIVAKARKIKPSIAVSCDIMTGFPYETEEDFNNTVKFLQDIKPMRTHIFRFSPRENTVFEGAKIKNESDISKRYVILKRLAENFSFEYKNNFLGNSLYMVAEENKDGLTSGYTENYIRVFLEENVPLGNIVKVKVNKVIGDKVYAQISK